MLLLLSLLLMIVLHPVLDHGTLRRLFMEALIFVPVLLATLRLSQIKTRLWPSVSLMIAATGLAVLGNLWPNPVVIVAKWGALAVFFALAVVGLFSFLRNTREVTETHLFTAVSIYLLLGMLWFSVYCAIDTYQPGSILQGGSLLEHRENQLLYFSLITLSTIGYGDIVPVGPEVRMLAALEGVVGVLYIAITVAILVSAFRAPRDRT
ncbi:MAG TPA: ion channel [Candidatus Binatia bacterium]|nr:ion channel [Candidatus Binatia bacterium]